MSDHPVLPTTIRKRTADGSEYALGYVAPDPNGSPDLIIYKARWGEGQPIGRIDATGRLFRRTAHDERELGEVTPEGRVRSHGLFEGGYIGWTDPDGVVVQAGLILGEEEVGAVDGPAPFAAGAALLLLFLPDEAEENRRAR